MRTFRVIAACSLLALSLVGCVYPTSKTEQGGVSSSLSFAGLPPSATISVDGAAIGTAADYAAKVLAVSPGTHRVTVQNGGQVLVDRDVYVGRDSTVKVAQ
jgi:hypothetical protein